jgi:hypothetical protein
MTYQGKTKNLSFFLKKSPVTGLERGNNGAMKKKRQQQGESGHDVRGWMFDLTQMGKWVNLNFVSLPGQDHFVCLPRLDLPGLNPKFGLAKHSRSAAESL